MTELLFMKWDHSTQSIPRPPARDLAALPRRFDLITAEPDGLRWGTEELSNPRFRIIAWPLLEINDAREFLSPLLPRLDINLQAVTYQQYRAFFLDLSSLSMPLALRSWWQDDSRAASKFSVSLPPSTVTAAVKRARAEVLLA